MKQLITLFFLMLSVSSLSWSQVQTNLVFFSEQGEQFLVVLNGVQQNFDPQTNVKVTNLIQPYYKVKIRFIDGRTPDIDKTINFNPGTETTFSIRKGKKGYVLRWLSEVPIAQVTTQPAAQQHVIVYHSEPYTAPPAPVYQEQVVQTHQHTQIQQPVQGQPGNVNMGIQINDPELGVNMNMQVNAGGVTTQHQQQHTQVITTTTTTQQGGIYQDPFIQQQVPVQQQQQQQHYVMPGYSGAVGCAWPMDETRFGQVMKSLSEKSFESSKLTIAKQVINNNCLTSDQVKRMMLEFSFEASRLDLAKYAYGFTYDIGNYYLLNDAFTFESSIEELNEYITGYKW
jgi:hypothetical protein